MEKLIITVAVIGGATTRKMNPNVPITPKEIAESAIASHRAGAAMCHIHVRDPQTHEISNDVKLFREVCDRIHDKCDMIINLSTGIGGRLEYDPANGEKAWNASNLQTPEERLAHVLELKPEVCSLDIGTLNFGPRAFVNVLGVVEKMAALTKEQGIKPELEVFDVGHLRIAAHLIESGLVSSPAMIQFCLGVRWGIDGTMKDLLCMHDYLPAGTVWSAFGVGRYHFSTAAAATILGGNVRIGFEDNVYIKRNVPAESNEQMVGKVVEIANLMDREVATPTEARKILKISR